LANQNRQAGSGSRNRSPPAGDNPPAQLVKSRQQSANGAQLRFLIISK
jgi:hypothetical protein